MSRPRNLDAMRKPVLASSHSIVLAQMQVQSREVERQLGESERRYEKLKQSSEAQIALLSEQLTISETKAVKALKRVRALMAQLSRILRNERAQTESLYHRNPANELALDPSDLSATLAAHLTEANGQLMTRLSELERQRNIEQTAYKDAMRDVERENAWLRAKMAEVEERWLKTVMGIVTGAGTSAGTNQVANRPVNAVLNGFSNTTVTPSKMQDALETAVFKQPASKPPKPTETTPRKSPILNEKRLPTELPPQDESSKKRRISLPPPDPDETQIPMQDAYFAIAADHPPSNKASVHSNHSTLLSPPDETSNAPEPMVPSTESSGGPRSGKEACGHGGAGDAKSGTEVKAAPSKADEKSVSDVKMPPKQRNSEQQQPNYKYQEVVRDKLERRKLHGSTCPCCNEFYQAVGHVPPILDLGQPEPKVKNAHMNRVSRHRAQFVPQDTPDGFWDVGFPSTAKLEEVAEARRVSNASAANGAVKKS
ncbi:hypothetical protein BC830DRAFT_661694 [Chytriomyces sp. MP71]|nr:hypothetical protein BC830DRAFT_661694 [Chytriomyces sp. MP71]